MKHGRALALVLILACALNLGGCASAQPKKQTAVGFYLDTVITLTAYVDDATVLNDALAESSVSLYLHNDTMFTGLQIR